MLLKGTEKKQPCNGVFDFIVVESHNVSVRGEKNI